MNQAGGSVGRDVAAAALSAVDAELQAALAILFDRRCRDGAQACVHLARAWHGLARFASTNDGDTGSANDDLVSRLQAEDLVSLGARERVEWERSLRAIVGIGATEPWELAHEHEVAPSRGELLRHCRWLERSIGTARSRFGVEIGSRPRRIWLLSIGALATAVAISAWISPRGGSAGAVWRGAYYAGTELTGEPIIRNDPDVFFDWGDASPLPAIPADGFSATWDSCLHLDRRAAIRFVLGSDDGSRLSVAGKLVVDNWGAHDFRIAEGEMILGPGVYPVHIEFFDKLGAARVALRAAFDSGPLQALPTDHLSLPRLGGDGAPGCPAP